MFLNWTRVPKNWLDRNILVLLNRDINTGYKVLKKGQAIEMSFLDIANHTITHGFKDYTPLQEGDITILGELSVILNENQES